MKGDLVCLQKHELSKMDTQIKKKIPCDEDIFSLSDTFKLLSDSTRLKIIFALMNKELCVCDIGEVVGMTGSAVSHQLRLLRCASLVKYRKSGKQVFYSLDDEHVYGIIAQTYEHIKHKKGE
ncbi:MAG: metalloregulator ArsR/SmtB family transcription factor [Oscillospiraceae bacterium]